MSNISCEHCGERFGRITMFSDLKEPYKNLTLCKKCEELPLKQIVRKPKGEPGKIIVGDNSGE